MWLFDFSVISFITLIDITDHSVLCKTFASLNTSNTLREAHFQYCIFVNCRQLNCSVFCLAPDNHSDSETVLLQLPMADWPKVCERMLWEGQGQEGTSCTASNEICIQFRKGEHSWRIFIKSIFICKVKSPLNVLWTAKSWKKKKKIPQDVNYNMKAWNIITITITWKYHNRVNVSTRTYSAFIVISIFKQWSDGATITDNTGLYFIAWLKLDFSKNTIGHFSSSLRATSCWKQGSLRKTPDCQRREFMMVYICLHGISMRLTLDITVILFRFS